MGIRLFIREIHMLCNFQLKALDYFTIFTFTIFVVRRPYLMALSVKLLFYCKRNCQLSICNCIKTSFILSFTLSKYKMEHLTFQHYFYKQLLRTTVTLTPGQQVTIIFTLHHITLGVNPQSLYTFSKWHNNQRTCSGWHRPLHITIFAFSQLDMHENGVLLKSSDI